MNTLTSMEQEQTREAMLKERQQQRFLNKSRQIASKYLQKLEALPGAPAEMQYFTGLLREVFVENRPIRYREEEIFIGTFCVMMPQELIYAAGARPLKLCSGNYVGFQLGDDVAPRDACPLVKSVIGNTLSGTNGIYNVCDMYVVPITCDCKKKMAGQLNQYKPTIPLYVPLNKTDDEGLETYVQELKRATAEISKRTGIEVTLPRLNRQIVEMASAQREVRRFVELKGNSDLLIRGSHAMAVLNTMAYDDISHWASHLKKLNDELECRKRKKDYLTKKKLPRILITGSPVTFPNLKIPLLIEEQGGVVAADETCLGDRGLTDPVSVAENSLAGYYKALANRYVAPCSCPIFSQNTQRIHRIEQMIKDNRIDGIIYHVLRGCLVYDYEYTLLEKTFGAKGIPIIRVESDYNEEDLEQLRIRIEAFIEMIKFKK